MATLRYAAYGSNLHPRRLAARIPSARLQGTAFLDEHSLHFHKKGIDGSAKCNILAEGSGVFLAVYTIAATEKPALDKIEHVGIGYDVATLDLPGFGECFTYLATASHVDNSLLPYCWYHELVLEGCRRLDLPGDYVSTVRAVARRDDPDSLRRQKNWDLVHSLRTSP
jgi:hypothetical protein